VSASGRTEARIAPCAACSIGIPLRVPLVIVHMAPMPTQAMHGISFVKNGSSFLAYTDQTRRRYIPSVMAIGAGE
jgi:hypothetical protein